MRKSRISPSLALRSLVLLGFALASLISCRGSRDWRSSTLFFFDTVCEVRLYCSSSAFRAAQKNVSRIFTEIEALFSPGVENASSSSVLYLYRRAAEIYKQTQGVFDITVAPLTAAWGFLDNAPRVPSKERIDALLPLVGMNKVQEQTGHLVLVPGMSLDWGGIAKGYGVDLAGKALVEAGIPSGFINAGGDLICWGKNPDGLAWQVGIKHPRRGGYLGVLSLSGVGAATTGDYQRYFVENERRYHHVFNPKTGYPAQGKQCVTVCGPEALVCDALSTALFVSSNPADILEKFPDYGALVVDEHGELAVLGKPYPFRPL